MEGQIREVIRQKIVDGLAAPVPTHTRRDIRVPAVPKKAIAVIGARRAGKTTFLWQIAGDRLAAGTPREALLYFGFEDERLAGMTARDLGIVLEEYFRLHPEWRGGGHVSFFFDEVQVVPGWEAFARRLLDSEPVELFLSGSSAKLLSREVASSMRGRAMEALVLPFSFREYLRHHGREPRKDAARLTKADRSTLDRDLRQYLASGGFPEAQDVSPSDRFELLRGYVDVTLLRDVIERHAVSQPVALRWLTRHLLGNAAGSFSVSKFYGDLRAQGSPVAKDTLHAFLGYLEDAFLIRTVSIAAGSERRRMVNPRKIYPIDSGYIPIFDRAGRANLGHALETCVLLELTRRGLEVYYVRSDDGSEVDFLTRDIEGREAMIQVCAELDDPATQEREVRGLVAASAQYPRAKLELVTMTPEAARDLPRAIAVHSAAAWLLA
jgi:hypothetical protein